MPLGYENENSLIRLASYNTSWKFTDETLLKRVNYAKGGGERGLCPKRNFRKDAKIKIRRKSKKKPIQ